MQIKLIIASEVISDRVPTNISLELEPPWFASLYTDVHNFKCKLSRGKTAFV